MTMTRNDNEIMSSPMKIKKNAKENNYIDNGIDNET